jgi:radical SAM protein with 4Fe4S-binding SPASM domain
MNDKYAMTGHKLLWHPDRVSGWLRGERIAPLHIELGITTGCNLACVFCYGQVMGQDAERERFEIPKEAILRLFKDAKEAGVRSITLIGEGENTLHRHFYDVLDYAQEINLDMALSTNGILLAKDKIKGMMEALTWMRVNISAATPESYVAIHGRDRFERVTENIRACVETKKKYGLRVTIGMQMVLTERNAADIVPLAALGKELGADYLVIKPCSDAQDKRLNVHNEEYLKLNDVYQKAESYGDDNYSVIVKWNKLGNLGLNTYGACRGTQFIIAINGRGDVAPCGHLFGYRKDDFHMGNIIEQSFRNIVASERYWEVQQKVQTLNVNSECESNCLHHYINHFLENLSNPPQHINFV